ncbi:MAG: transglutaminase-like domain-containing protein [Salibacteraceae bacterium]
MHLPDDPTELNALISLLDDPDETIYLQIRNRLLSIGSEVIPALESAWEHNAFGMLFQNRVEAIVHDIQFTSVFDQLKTWASQGGPDLLDGLMLLSRYQYPDLDEEPIRKLLDQITRDIWLELNDKLTALEKVRVINHILFEVYGFGGNTTNYHAPQNSYINNVVESRKGNPISLSAIYTILASRLELPIFGINLPKHFVLAYVDLMTMQPGISIGEAEILFYINPFSRGGVFSRKEIDFFLKQLDLKPDPKFFSPCNNLTIVRRMLNNLTYSYHKLGYPDKVAEIEKLGNALPPEDAA